MQLLIPKHSTTQNKIPIIEATDANSHNDGQTQFKINFTALRQGKKKYLSYKDSAKGVGQSGINTNHVKLNHIIFKLNNFDFEVLEETFQARVVDPQRRISSGVQNRFSL